MRLKVQKYFVDRGNLVEKFSGVTQNGPKLQHILSGFGYNIERLFLKPVHYTLGKPGRLAGSCFGTALIMPGRQSVSIHYRTRRFRNPSKGTTTP
jgi:hypothetical protein